MGAKRMISGPAIIPRIEYRMDELATRRCVHILPHGLSLPNTAVRGSRTGGWTLSIYHQYGLCSSAECSMPLPAARTSLPAPAIVLQPAMIMNDIVRNSALKARNQ